MSKHTNPEVEAAYAAAKQILIDCSHPTGRADIRMTDGTMRDVCCNCWNAQVAARKVARKMQLALHRADLPKCEGPHAKPTPGRWDCYGVKLCGRCKTKAKDRLERRVFASGASILFAFGGARFDRDSILGALRDSA